MCVWCCMAQTTTIFEQSHLGLSYIYISFRHPILLWYYHTDRSLYLPHASNRMVLLFTTTIHILYMTTQCSFSGWVSFNHSNTGWAFPTQPVCSTRISNYSLAFKQQWHNIRGHFKFNILAKDTLTCWDQTIDLNWNTDLTLLWITQHFPWATVTLLLAPTRNKEPTTGC